MKKQDWLLNRNQGYITLSAFLFAVALLLTSLLARNNINFINYFYACVDTLLAFVVTGVLAWLWRSIRADRINVSIIAWLFFGFLLWAVAEGIWAVLAIVEGEIPYPSIADYFFIVGYIPFYVALIKRYRSFHIRPTFRQRIYIFAAVSIVSAVTIIFILLPIIRSFDVQDLFVSFLNLFYPLGDLALLLLVVAVFNKIGRAHV